MRRLIVCIALLLLACAGQAYAFFGIFGDSTEKAVARDGQISLDVAALEKGQAKHYVYKEGAAEVRFFVVRDTQGSVRAALDACEVCWHAGKGYKLKGGAMLCVNCGMQFPLDRIGQVRGGCNPHPVAFTRDHETLTVSSQELLAGTRYFSGKN